MTENQPSPSDQKSTISSDNELKKYHITDTGDSIVLGTLIPLKAPLISEKFKFEGIKRYPIDTLTSPKSTLKSYTIKLEPQTNNFILDTSLLQVTSVESSFHQPHKHSTTNSTGQEILTGVKLKISGKKQPALLPEINEIVNPPRNNIPSYQVQNIDVEQGLSSSYIRSLASDRKNNMWIGTFGQGLSKFDGRFLSQYTTNHGLMSNDIWKVCTDSLDNIWFSSFLNGITKFDGESFTHYTENDGLIGNQRNHIISDKNGNIWISSIKSGVSMLSGQTIIHYTTNEGLCSNKIQTILSDSKGNIWFGSTDGGVSKFDGKTFTTYTEKDHLCSNNIISLFEDSKGNIWLGSNKNGVSMFDGTSFITHTLKGHLLDNAIVAIAEDSQFSLWFSTKNSGVFKYEETQFTQFNSDNALPMNYVSDILCFQDNQIWLATFSGGIVKFDKNGINNFNDNSSLTKKHIINISQDSNEVIWFGSLRDGLIKLENNSVSSVHSTNKRLTENISSVYHDSLGIMWIMTFQNGLIKFDGEVFEAYANDAFPFKAKLKKHHTSKNGHFWFTTANSGILIFDGEYFSQLSKKQGLLHNHIVSFLEDSDGNKWLGSRETGLTKLQNDSLIHYTTESGLSDNRITTIFEDSKKNIWVGTRTGGVCIFNGTNFQTLSTKDGLSDNKIYSIEEDKKGMIWLSTEKGLCVIENFQGVNHMDSSNLKFHKLGLLDGIISQDFYLNSSYLDSQNSLWWGGSKGLSHIELDQFKLSNNRPEIEFHKIDINEKTLDLRDSTLIQKKDLTFEKLERFSNLPSELELNHDQNHLTFYFSAPVWHASHTLKYSHKLVGIHENWSSLNSDTRVDFVNLNPGNYEFKVKAIGESQVWSEPVSYSFQIAPPWQYTWWAYLLYFIYGTLAFLSIIYWRTKNLSARKYLLEYKIKLATDELRTQKEKVEKAHKDMNDSLKYAKRIQKAMFPSNSTFKQHLPESFVFYNPKEQIAGDFYWLKFKNDTLYIATADCTGHGVPGALLSVFCNNGLNRSISEYGERDPGKILDKTREIIISELQHDESELQDGMDIALCSLTGRTLKYAGANIPLWLITDNVIIETSPDKKPIGNYRDQSPYTTYSIDIQTGDVIYMFTDGYRDQFGGEKGKKFKTSGFRNLLLAIHKKPMDEQKKILEKTFSNWKGNLEQIDDVCVIGIRF